MFKTLLRPAMIFGAFALGILFPAGASLQWAIRYILIFMMTMAFVRLDFAHLRPKMAHFILLAVNVAMGLIPFAAAKIIAPDRPDIALAAFFTGITPTATAAPVVMSFLNGRVEFVVTGFLVTNFGIAILLIPLIPLVTGQGAYSFDFNVIYDLAIVTLLPFTAAWLLRKIYPPVIQIAPKLKLFSFALWVFILYILAGVAVHHFRDNPDENTISIVVIICVSFVICALNFMIGALVGGKRYRRESSQTLGQKNTTLTIYLALTYASPLASMGPLFYILWHNTYNAVQMFIYDRHKQKKEQRVFTGVKESVKG